MRVELCHNPNCAFSEPHWHYAAVDPDNPNNYITSTHWLSEPVERIEMEFTTFVRKPFKVEAVEVTVENIGDIAKFVGDLKEKEDGTPFILVDRRLVPNVFRVYPGFFMTKMGENIRCYSRKIFAEQFTPLTDDIVEWVNWMTGEAEAPAPEVQVELAVAQE